MKNIPVETDCSNVMEINEDDNFLETICPDLNSSRKSERSSKKRHKRHKDIERFTLADVTPCYNHSPSGYGVKGKGKRRQNRIENVKFLLSFWDKDDLDEEILEDEPIPTIFSKVVTDEDTRKIWNKFASLSGQEQDEYLAFIEQSENRRRQWTKMGTGENTDNPAFRADVVDTTKVHDVIVENVGCQLTADECYLRIERHLRNALTKKHHVPLGILENLETELITFFERWPSSKYTSVLSSSYERLLLHALCQYLGLLSQSVTSNGNRCTHVENKKQSSFQPPPITLSRYLKERL